MDNNNKVLDINFSSISNSKIGKLGKLLGFVDVRLRDINLSAIGVWKKESKIAITLPAKTIRSGQLVFYFSLSSDLRKNIEEAVQKYLDENYISEIPIKTEEDLTEEFLKTKEKVEEEEEE